MVTDGNDVVVVVIKMINDDSMMMNDGGVTNDCDEWIVPENIHTLPWAAFWKSEGEECLESY